MIDKKSTWNELIVSLSAGLISAAKEDPDPCSHCIEKAEALAKALDATPMPDFYDQVPDDLVKKEMQKDIFIAAALYHHPAARDLVPHLNHIMDVLASRDEQVH